eukprot:TRINITY_DN11555_c0_g1_i1.p1 TRINITY_DN11555_c0_g1~~TRINITY_DN11555_c0_g1_i1.p1  ORF type:complete len:467 (+),score=177.39 TRINITY_DN11555_c0_g1_i1:1436-2836(+)
MEHLKTYIQLDGSLMKKSGKKFVLKSPWQKRYFVLNAKEQKLTFYKSREDKLAHNKEAGEILFENMDDVVFHPNKRGGRRFDLKTNLKDNKVYKFYAVTKEEAQQWVHAIFVTLPSRNRAALSMQKLWRGHKVRKEFAVKKLEMDALKKKRLEEDAERAHQRSLEIQEKMKAREATAKAMAQTTHGRLNKLAVLRAKKAAALKKKQEEEESVLAAEEERKKAEEEEEQKKLEDETAAAELKEKEEEEMAAAEAERAAEAEKIEKEEAAAEAKRVADLEKEKLAKENEEMKMKEEKQKQRTERSMAETRISSPSARRRPFRGGKVATKFDATDSKVQNIWETIKDDYTNESWAVFTVSSANKLRVLSSGCGCGIDNVIENFTDDDTYFAAFRVLVDEWFRFVIVLSVGEAQGQVQKAMAMAAGVEVFRQFEGSHVTLICESLEDLSRESIVAKFTNHTAKGAVDFED